MKSNEFKKILAMVHIVLALLAFAISIWQISILKEITSSTAMNTDSFYVLARALTLIGLFWAVALATCAISLITEKRRTFCQLVSVFNLFLFPIGTILGGLTLYALRIKQDNVSTIKALEIRNSKGKSLDRQGKASCHSVTFVGKTSS